MCAYFLCTIAYLGYIGRNIQWYSLASAETKLGPVFRNLVVKVKHFLLHVYFPWTKTNSRIQKILITFAILLFRRSMSMQTHHVQFNSMKIVFAAFFFSFIRILFTRQIKWAEKCWVCINTYVDGFLSCSKLMNNNCDQHVSSFKKKKKLEISKY